MKHIDIRELTGAEVLAGAATAMTDLSSLVSKLPPPGAPVIIALDFRNVSVATASYLREFVIGFRDFTRRNRPDLFPIISNLNAIINEELGNLLVATRDAVLVGHVDGGRVRKARVLGSLEEKERLTLEAVIASPDIDASRLLENSKSSDAITTNAWNNRLAGLVAKRLVIETRQGRTKRFSPVIRNVEYGR